MKGIDEIRSIINERIKNLKYPNFPESLYQPIEYIMNLPSKRMRPVLLLMAHQLFDENIEEGISPALAIEFFHNFTLLHDEGSEYSRLNDLLKHSVKESGLNGRIRTFKIDTKAEMLEVVLSTDMEDYEQHIPCEIFDLQIGMGS